MTDLVTVAISGGSVCLGAGLTMLGQYLGDRRSHIRDREARREGFKISNYEIQREALLELQEHVLKLSIFVRDATALGIAADLRPDYTGHVGDWRHAERFYTELEGKASEVFDWIDESKRGKELADKMSDEEKIAFLQRGDRVSEEFGRMGKLLKEYKKRVYELNSLTSRMKILSARSGNRRIIASCKTILETINLWMSSKGGEESTEFFDLINQQAEKMIDEVGLALQEGPFSANALAWKP